MSSVGSVKWFNKKAGYGFITVSSGEESGSDIFVHHSSLSCEEDQYRYLVQGEYVSFTLEATSTDDVDSSHKWKAVSVTGMSGGKLMCEAQRRAVPSDGSPRAPRRGGRGPREVRQTLPSHVPGHDWVLMKSRRAPGPTEPSLDA